MKVNQKIPKINRSLAALALLAFLISFPAFSQEIVQRRGVDTSLNYETLKRYGPWDDRNYRVTSEDLKLLAPNEAELHDPIPVFYRIQLRKKYPNMLRSGPVQYPRSALQLYEIECGGYLVNDKMYQKVKLENGQFKVVEDTGAPDQMTDPSRFLAGELRVTSPPGAAESAIKISPVDPNLVIAGTNGPGGGQRMHFSSDGGETWTMVDLPLGNTCCDPTVDWSSDGQHAYTATLGVNSGSLGIWFYRSGDNGQTWTDLQNITPGDPRRELTTGGSDKEYIHVDKHAGSPHLDNVYLTWHNSNVLQFARSTDRGNTWTTTSFNADPRGIGSDITTDRNGRVYYFYPAFDTRQILLKRSNDGGATFLPGTVNVSATNGSFDFPIPSIESRRAWIYVAADADLSNGPFGGSVYAAWTDTDAAEDEGNANNNHTRIRVAFSRTGGGAGSWTVVTPHPTADINTVDRWNPWLAVGQDGTVHLIYYDTRHSVNRTGVDLYYSFSTDGAQTFSTPQRLTSVTSTNLTDAFEFGDYNGLDHVVCQIAIYTDNRNEAGGSGNSKDVYTIGIDNTRPTIACPPNFTVNTAPGQCSAPANYTAIATDECSSVAVNYTPALGAPLAGGNTLVTATAVDGAGNERSCTFTVTVEDHEAPVINCPANVTQSCELSTDPSVTGNPLALDNCSIAQITHADIQTPGSCPGNYTIRRTWTARDPSGNISSCVQVIRVQDITPPTINCPANITVTCVTTPDSTGFATATDNCDLSPTLSYLNISTTGDCDWLCTIERLWTATDHCGNTSTCIQIITKSTLPLIEQALNADVDGDGRTDVLKLGTSNSSLEIPPGRGNCILQWIPGLGTDPKGMTFKKSVVGADCLPGTNPLDGDDKLVNPLLEEALKLNVFVRLKPSLGTTKLSTTLCLDEVTAHYLAPDPDINELIRVVNTALGNVAVAPHLNELLAVLRCINGPLDVCSL